MIKNGPCTMMAHLFQRTNLGSGTGFECTHVPKHRVINLLNDCITVPLNDSKEFKQNHM